MRAMLAALLLVTSAWTVDAQQAREAAAPLTAVGCIAQMPDSPAAPPTGHEQDAAKGLTLTRATTRTDARASAGRSAVPGSQPAGSGSGTTDGNTVNIARVEQSFWLVGAKAAELLRFVGRRVEVSGTIDEKLAANPGGQGLADAGGAAARRASDAPPDPPTTAHPSAPTRAISVSTFRTLDESCS